MSTRSVLIKPLYNQKHYPQDPHYFPKWQTLLYFHPTKEILAEANTTCHAIYTTNYVVCLYYRIFHDLDRGFLWCECFWYSDFSFSFCYVFFEEEDCSPHVLGVTESFKYNKLEVLSMLESSKEMLDTNCKQKSHSGWERLKTIWRATQ